jgi:hypothetical protein
MASLKLTTEEFADIVIAFLMDRIANPEVAAGNERFNNLMEVAKKSIRHSVLSSYLDMPPKQRVRYKKIQDVFRGGNNAHRIVIGPSDEVKDIETTPKKKDSILKKVIKKIMDDDSYDLREKEILKEYLLEEENEQIK